MSLSIEMSRMGRDKDSFSKAEVKAYLGKHT